MLKFILLLIAMSTVITTHAQKLADYKWENRIILIFGENQNKQLLTKQKEVFDAEKKGLEERDLKVFVNPETKEMKRLRNETGFEVILIGKDGSVKKRKTELMTTEELFAIIDSMPMRQSEMRRKN